MLVFCRNEGESIVFVTESGDEIVVSLEAVQGCRAKLGVTAPQTVLVLQEELYAEPTER